MTVAELIEKLKTYPDDTKVDVGSAHGDGAYLFIEYLDTDEIEYLMEND